MGITCKGAHASPNAPHKKPPTCPFSDVDLKEGDSAAATLDLVWEIARPMPRVEQVSEFVSAGADMRIVQRLATDHGLGPMLWRAISAAGCTPSLGAGAETLESEANLWRMLSRVVVPQALELSVGLLGAAGFEPVVWKGPSISARYPEPWMRPMVDVDLLLPENQHADAVLALQHGGWSVTREVDRVHYDTVLIHPAIPGLALELHCGTDLWWERSTRMTLDGLWQRRRSVELFGLPTFGLPTEVELISLATHAGKPFHCFGRLVWTTDLVVVVESTRPHGLDWDLVDYLAREWKCQSVLAAGLAQARRLGAECPDHLSRLPGSSIRRRALKSLIDDQWPLISADPGVRRRLRYALADSAGPRVRLFLGAPTPFTPLRRWPAMYARLLPAAVRRGWRLYRGRSDPSDKEETRQTIAARD